MASAEGTITPSFDLTQKWSTSEELSNTASLTYAYAYSTSSDAYNAGKLSDAFLTPALDVKFSKSALIGFDVATCSATYKEIISWRLDSPTNVPVSFDVEF